jgi:hypothetical protein
MYNLNKRLWKQGILHTKMKVAYLKYQITLHSIGTFWDRKSRGKQAIWPEGFLIFLSLSIQFWYRYSNLKYASSASLYTHNLAIFMQFLFYKNVPI